MYVVRFFLSSVQTLTVVSHRRCSSILENARRAKFVPIQRSSIHSIVGARGWLTSCYARLVFSLGCHHLGRPFLAEEDCSFLRFMFISPFAHHVVLDGPSVILGRRAGLLPVVAHFRVGKVVHSGRPTRVAHQSLIPWRHTARTARTHTGSEIEGVEAKKGTVFKP